MGDETKTEKKGLLHQLLAVEGDAKAGAQRAVTKATKLFTDGTSRFLGQERYYHPFQDDGEKLPPENVVRATSVADELKLFWEMYGRWIDVVVQKEETNTQAAADIDLDDVGETLLNLPATALLTLESKLAEIRRVYAKIPVNEMSQRWTLDKEQGCYVSDMRVQYRTQKQQGVNVLYPATEEHPAQTESYTHDVQVGKWETTITSGAVSPETRRKYLNRIDELIRAVKRARQKANTADASKRKIAQELLAYIHQDDD